MSKRRRTHRQTSPSRASGAAETPVLFLLEPQDSWFFRDGRPFDAGDPAQSAVSSFFPPMPQTAIGAVRTAVALALGWDGRSDWSDKEGISSVVGSGNDLGRLAHADVSLVRIRGQAIEPLYAAPHLLFGHGASGGALWGISIDASLKKPLERLRPGASVISDLGTMRLPQLPPEGRDCQPLGGRYWLTVRGIDACLGGSVPEVHQDSIVAAGDVFHRETRTGLQIDRASRAAKTGMLYRVTHTRPRTGFAVAVGVAALPSSVVSRLPRAVPFGGEGRMAWLATHAKRSLQKATAPGELARDPRTDMLRYAVTLASPGDLPAPWPRPGQPLADLPGTICSACFDRALPVSGWIGGGGAFGPRESRATIPAGATWFLEAPAGRKQEILKAHGRAIGDRTAWGYGRILIGTWS